MKHGINKLRVKTAMVNNLQRTKIPFFPFILTSLCFPFAFPCSPSPNKTLQRRLPSAEVTTSWWRSRRLSAHCSWRPCSCASASRPRTSTRSGGRLRKVLFSCFFCFLGWESLVIIIVEIFFFLNGILGELQHGAFCGNRCSVPKH